MCVCIVCVQAHVESESSVLGNEGRSAGWQALLPLEAHVSGPQQTKL